MHVLVRSLAQRRAARRASSCGSSRATTRCWPRSRPTPHGRVAFDPGLSRGQGGSAPEPGGRHDSRATTASSTSARPPSTSPTAASKGRVAPKALDALLYTERGVYRSGETVNVTALLRDLQGRRHAGPAADAGGQAAGRRRVQARRGRRPGARRPRLLAAAAPRRGARHLAGRRPMRIPKAPALGEVTFLVEDYVPERLEFDLKPRAAQPALRRAGADRRRGALSLRRARRRARRHRRIQHPAAGGRGAAGPRRLCGRPAGRALRERLGRDRGQGRRPTTRGHAAVTVELPDVAAPRPLQAQITLRVGETGRPRGRAHRHAADPPEGAGPGGQEAVRRPRRGRRRRPSTSSSPAPDGQRLARKGLHWTLQKVERRYQWFNQDGRWNYEAVKSARRDRGRDDRRRRPTSRRGSASRCSWGATGWTCATAATAATPASPSTVGWSGDATRRHARHARRVARQADLHGRRHDASCKLAPALRRQGDGRGRRRQGARADRRRRDGRRATPS